MTTNYKTRDLMAFIREHMYRQTGHHLAIIDDGDTWWLRFRALAEAAYAVHPQFEQRDDGMFRWLGDDCNQLSEVELIDWFQKTYPAEARAIERAIEKSA
jgi:hypothetical protein